METPKENKKEKENESILTFNLASTEIDMPDTQAFFIDKEGTVTNLQLMNSRQAKPYFFFDNGKLSTQDQAYNKILNINLMNTSDTFENTSNDLTGPLINQRQKRILYFAAKMFPAVKQKVNTNNENENTNIDKFRIVLPDYASEEEMLKLKEDIQIAMQLAKINMEIEFVPISKAVVTDLKYHVPNSDPFNSLFVNIEDDKIEYIRHERKDKDDTITNVVTIDFGKNDIKNAFYDVFFEEFENNSVCELVSKDEKDKNFFRALKYLYELTPEGLLKKLSSNKIDDDLKNHLINLDIVNSQRQLIPANYVEIFDQCNIWLNNFKTEMNIALDNLALNTNTSSHFTSLNSDFQLYTKFNGHKYLLALQKKLDLKLSSLAKQLESEENKNLFKEVSEYQFVNLQNDTDVYCIPYLLNNVHKKINKKLTKAQKVHPAEASAEGAIYIDKFPVKFKTKENTNGENLTDINNKFQKVNNEKIEIDTNQENYGYCEAIVKDRMFENNKSAIIDNAQNIFLKVQSTVKNRLKKNYKKYASEIKFANKLNANLDVFSQVNPDFLKLLPKKFELFKENNKEFFLEQFKIEKEESEKEKSEKEESEKKELEEKYQNLDISLMMKYLLKANKYTAILKDAFNESTNSLLTSIKSKNQLKNQLNKKQIDSLNNLSNQIQNWTLTLEENSTTNLLLPFYKLSCINNLLELAPPDIDLINKILEGINDKEIIIVIEKQDQFPDFMLDKKSLINKRNKEIEEQLNQLTNSMLNLKPENDKRKKIQEQIKNILGEDDYTFKNIKLVLNYQYYNLNKDINEIENEYKIKKAKVKSNTKNIEKDDLTTEQINQYAINELETKIKQAFPDKQPKDIKFYNQLLSAINNNDETKITENMTKIFMLINNENDNILLDSEHADLINFDDLKLDEMLNLLKAEDFNDWLFDFTSSQLKDAKTLDEIAKINKQYNNKLERIALSTVILDLKPQPSIEQIITFCQEANYNLYEAIQILPYKQKTYENFAKLDNKLTKDKKDLPTIVSAFEFLHKPLFWQDFKGRADNLFVDTSFSFSDKDKAKIKKYQEMIDKCERAFTDKKTELNESTLDKKTNEAIDILKPLVDSNSIPENILLDCLKNVKIETKEDFKKLKTELNLSDGVLYKLLIDKKAKIEKPDDVAVSLLSEEFTEPSLYLGKCFNEFNFNNVSHDKLYNLFAEKTNFMHDLKLSTKDNNLNSNLVSWFGIDNKIITSSKRNLSDKAKIKQKAFRTCLKLVIEKMDETSKINFFTNCDPNLKRLAFKQLSAQSQIMVLVQLQNKANDKNFISKVITQCKPEAQAYLYETKFVENEDENFKKLSFEAQAVLYNNSKIEQNYDNFQKLSPKAQALAVKNCPKPNVNGWRTGWIGCGIGSAAGITGATLGAIGIFSIPIVGWIAAGVTGLACLGAGIYTGIKAYKNKKIAQNITNIENERGNILGNECNDGKELSHEEIMNLIERTKKALESVENDFERPQNSNELSEIKLKKPNAQEKENYNAIKKCVDPKNDNFKPLSNKLLKNNIKILKSQTSR